MRDDAFRLRAIVVKEPDNDWPTIAGAVSNEIWAIIDPAEWDRDKREILDKWIGPDWPSCDVTEAVLEVPYDALRRLFSPAIPVEHVEGVADGEAA